MATAPPAVTAQQSQIDRIRNRALGSSAPYVRDSRRAQSAPKIVEPTAEQVTAAQKSFGVDPSRPAAKKEILCHSCFDQRHDETKPRDCRCDTYIEYSKARNLIDKGFADFLIYRRAGREHQNRKSIVLTADFLRMQAKSHDALNHKLPLSIAGFIDSTTGYHIAFISGEATSGLNQEINHVRMATIHERTVEVKSRRKHCVRPAGLAIDSDSSVDDMVSGQGVGQMSSRPDSTAKGLGSQSPYFGTEKIGRKTLPKPIYEVVGKQEAAEFRKETRQTTIMTGVD